MLMMMSPIQGAINYGPEGKQIASALGNSTVIGARGLKADLRVKVLIPRALAFLRRTVSSKLVGACTRLGLPTKATDYRLSRWNGSTSEVQQ